MRLLVIVLLLVGVGCDKPLKTTGPTPILEPWPSHGPDADVFTPVNEGVQCSDSAVRLITKSHTVDGTSFWLVWESKGRGYTYQVETVLEAGGLVQASAFTTERAELRVPAPEPGHYLVRVRVVHNPCGDVVGGWSEQIRVAVGSATEDQGTKKYCRDCHR